MGSTGCHSNGNDCVGAAGLTLFLSTIGFWWCLVPPRLRDGVISCDTDAGLPNSEDGDGVQPGSDEGKIILGVGVVGGANTPSGVFTSDLTTVGLCGVWKDVGTGEAVAVVFRSGWVLDANMAFFNLCANRSAFNAAAVVMATFGVTFRGRFDDDTAS